MNGARTKTRTEMKKTAQDGWFMPPRMYTEYTYHKGREMKSIQKME